MTVKINELDDPQTAAEVAVQDLEAFIESANQSVSAINPEGGILSAIGLFAGIAGTASSIAKTGLDLAKLINPESAEEPGNFEIVISNNTKYPVVPYTWDSTKGDVSDSADPLLPTESTTFLLTYDKAFVSGDHSDGSGLDFSLMINNVSLDFSYYFDKHWYFGYRVTPSSDSASSSDFIFFSDDESLVGGQVTTSDSSSTFDFFSAGIESSNGKVQLNLFSTDWS